jgi:hypothetical protein
MNRSSALRGSLVVAAGAWLMGCTGGDRTSQDSASVTARDTASASNATRRPVQHDFDKVVAEAQPPAYTYESSPRPPVNAKNPDDIKHNGVPQNAVPTRFTIAKATRTNPPTQLTEEVLALIDSDQAYAELGILPGNNYIWRYRADADKTKWEVWMVPQRAPQNAKPLTRSSEALSDGVDPTQPRIVRAEKTRLAVVSIAFGTCLEDPVCTSGHCGYQ